MAVLVDQWVDLVFVAVALRSAQTAIRAESLESRQQASFIGCENLS